VITLSIDYDYILHNIFFTPITITLINFNEPVHYLTFFLVVSVKEGVTMNARHPDVDRENGIVGLTVRSLRQPRHLSASKSYC